MNPKNPMKTLLLNMNAYSAVSLYKRLISVLVVVAVCLLISSCTSGSGLPSDSSRIGADNGRIAACKATDQIVDSSNQCLQDDAACYQISNGQWCTGERGNICPAGSSALSAGASCPPGKRCFSVGESLECTIN